MGSHIVGMTFEICMDKEDALENDVETSMKHNLGDDLSSTMRDQKRY